MNIRVMSVIPANVTFRAKDDPALDCKNQSAWISFSVMAGPSDQVRGQACSGHPRFVLWIRKAG
jgi:hypothetical protein